MPILAARFLARFGSGYHAYLGVQCALLRHWERQGRAPEEFVTRLAPAFRARYGFLLHL